MEDFNRNRGNQSYGNRQDWDENRRFNQQDDNYNRDSENFGSFGNTSYGEDNNRGNNNYNMNDDYRGYGRMQNERDYGDNRPYDENQNVNYGNVYHGNVEQRERDTNRAQGGRYAGRGHMGNTGWGASGGYNSGSGNYNRDYDDYGGYGRSTYNQSQGGNYGKESGENRSWLDRTINKVSNKVSSWLDDDMFRGGEGSSVVRTGPHRGKGPRGYARTDDRIREDVNYRLFEDGYVDASDIEVSVESGEVILSGTVKSKEEKRRAEDLAETVIGVRNVQNRLWIGSSATQSGNTSSGNMGTSSAGNTTTGSDAKNQV